MRRIVREATFGLTDIESDDIWLCSTCGTCPQQCPRDVRQIESGVSLRRIATEYGVFPNTAKPVRGVSASLTAEGNPLSEPVRIVLPAGDKMIRPMEDTSLLLLPVNKSAGENPLQARTVWLFARYLGAGFLVLGLAGLLMPRRRVMPAGAV